MGRGYLTWGMPPEESGQLVAATVRLADPGEVALLKPGDLVDILAARAGGIAEETGAGQAAGSARVIAEKVRVVVVPDTASGGDASLFGGPSRSSDGGLDSGSMIVLGVDRPTATALAAAATRSRLSAIVRTDQLFRLRSSSRISRRSSTSSATSSSTSVWPPRFLYAFIGATKAKYTTAAVMTKVMIELIIKVKSKV